VRRLWATATMPFPSDAVSEFLYDPRNRVEWEESLDCVVPVSRHGDNAYTVYRRYSGSWLVSPREMYAVTGRAVLEDGGCLMATKSVSSQPHRTGLVWP
jgi:hypothetical protein